MLFLKCPCCIPCSLGLAFSSFGEGCSGAWARCNFLEIDFVLLAPCGFPLFFRLRSVFRCRGESSQHQRRGPFGNENGILRWGRNSISLGAMVLALCFFFGATAGFGKFWGEMGGYTCIKACFFMGQGPPHSGRL